MDERLALGTEGYSAALVAKIEYAGTNQESFQKAAENLTHVGDLSISVKHVQRITERLGRERAGQRDHEVEQMKAGELPPAYRQPPQVVAVHLDAGKIRLRAEDGRPGVRAPHWSDTKVACLQTYTSVPCEHDPQPEPPALFLDPPRVVRLCQEMEQVRGNPATRPKAAKADTPLVADTIGERPQRLVRTAVATMQGTEGFGWMVAAAAMRRGFYQAERRAVVGDGGNWIEPLGQMHFPAGSRSWTSCTCWSICMRRRRRPIGIWVPEGRFGLGGCMSKCCGRPGRDKSRRSRRPCRSNWSVWDRRRRGPQQTIRARSCRWSWTMSPTMRYAWSTRGIVARVFRSPARLWSH